MIPSVKKREGTLPRAKKGGGEVSADRATVTARSLLIDASDALIDKNISLISDSFVR